jgi:formiminoglutamase
MTGPPLVRNFEWVGGSGDPNDVQFGDLVVRDGLAAVDRAAVVLVGEPYDGAVIGRPGAAEGPRAIREALAGLKTHHFDAGPVGTEGREDAGDGGVGRPSDAVATAGLIDLGNVDYDVAGDVAAAQDRTRKVSRRLHSTDTVPVFLGGDNSVTAGNVGGLIDALEGQADDGGSGGSGDRVGVLNFDAHLDVREPHDGPTSGTPYRQLYDDGLADYVCVGARHFETSTVYHDYVRERDGTVVTSEEVGEDPVAAITRALEALRADQVYLSVDLDVLDATAAPGVSAPTPGGLTTRELFRAVRVATADPRLAGFEVVECAPPLDREGRTADAAARAVAHFIAALEVGA